MNALAKKASHYLDIQSFFQIQLKKISDRRSSLYQRQTISLTSTSTFLPSHVSPTIYLGSHDNGTKLDGKGATVPLPSTSHLVLVRV